MKVARLKDLPAGDHEDQKEQRGVQSKRLKLCELPKAAEQVGCSKEVKGEEQALFQFKPRPSELP